ncbi:MAG: polysaccharide biosynthesis protein [Deltaproteobacteria bacterium]|jgi:UDP-glucose 4-epimerase|nr:polysaccharide biosynthesis protein [Deltaproteobacteria bacterium]
MAMDLNKTFDGRRVLITGGTGSLGKQLVNTLLSGRYGCPAKIIIFSRDEAKQYAMRMLYERRVNKVSEEIIYNNFKKLLEFRLGDVRDFLSLQGVMRGIDIVINAAALKQVPSCEYFPHEASLTNIMGASNIVRAIEEHAFPVETVVGVSTDKACLPVNVMGMTKSLQERLFISGNINCPGTRFVCVRYGNVLASRGSVIPLFREQIKNGGPLTITTADMTRFLLPLNGAVTTIATAISEANPGETYVPKIASALITDVAKALIGDRDVPITTIGIRPGEKIHEMMISPEEGQRAYGRGDFYAIAPLLPELRVPQDETLLLGHPYSSHDHVMDYAETLALLRRHGLMLDDVREGEDSELLA